MFIFSVFLFVAAVVMFDFVRSRVAFFLGLFFVSIAVIDNARIV